MRSQIRQCVSWSGDILNYRKDRSSYWVRIVAKPLEYESENVRLWVGVKWDITSEMESAILLESHLKKVQAIKETFRNPECSGYCNNAS